MKASHVSKVLAADLACPVSICTGSNFSVAMTLCIYELLRLWNRVSKSTYRVCMAAVPASPQLVVLTIIFSYRNIDGLENIVLQVPSTSLILKDLVFFVRSLASAKQAKLSFRSSPFCLLMHHKCRTWLLATGTLSILLCYRKKLL